MRATTESTHIHLALWAWTCQQYMQTMGGGIVLKQDSDFRLSLRMMSELSTCTDKVSSLTPKTCCPSTRTLGRSPSTMRWTTNSTQSWRYEGNFSPGSDFGFLIFIFCNIYVHSNSSHLKPWSKKPGEWTCDWVWRCELRMQTTTLQLSNRNRFKWAYWSRPNKVKRLLCFFFPPQSSS